ncbi:MAG: hypothetical protein MI741_24410, partial [Rhodospirillales bacterium]|nr:hypothetical protein [Rhodospirillales bacterium]
MMRILLPAIACTLSSLLIVVPVAGQSDTGTSTAVDRGVEDRSDNAASLRYVDPAELNPATSALYDLRHSTWTDHGLPGLDASFARPFLYVAPGVRARMNEPDYLVQTGRRSASRHITPSQGQRWISVIPANTVFDLTSTSNEPLVLRQEPTDRAVGVAKPMSGNHIDGLIDGRVDRAINGEQGSRADKPAIAKPGYLPRDTPEEVFAAAIRRRMAENAKKQEQER